MATSGMGIVLASVFGFVATSALAYCCTAAAGIRLRQKVFTWLNSDDSEDGCDRWLHDCASSSADGAFIKQKEDICTMAAAETCEPHFVNKRSSQPSLAGGSHHRPNNMRQNPLALGWRTAESGLNAGSASATDKLQPYARLGVPPAWTLIGCNTLAWASIYLTCVAFKKERARRLRQARRASDVADGGGAGMAINGAAGVAGIAVGGGDRNNGGVGRSSEENAASVGVAQQAPVASESSQPRDGNHNEDRDPTVGDGIPSSNNRSGDNNNNSNSRTGRCFASVSPGRGSSADGRPYSGVSPSSPMSAPLCDVSPSRRVAPAPLTPRPPVPQDISGAIPMSSPVRSMPPGGTTGSESRDVSSKARGGKPSIPLAAVEGSAEQGGKAAGERGIDSAVTLSALTAPSPDPASPPNIRGAKPSSGSSSAIQANSELPPPPSEPLSMDKDVVEPDSDMLSARTIGGDGPNLSPANSSGAAKSTGEDGASGTGGELDTTMIVAPLAPASPPARFSAAPLTPISSEATLSGESSREEVGSTRDTAVDGRAIVRLGLRLFETRREIRSILGFGSPDSVAPADSPVSVRSGAPVSEASSSEVPGSDGTATQAPSSSSSVLDAPATPSSIHSACWTMLGEGLTRPPSLHGMNDLEMDEVSSADLVGALTPDTDDSNGGFPYHGEMLSHAMLEAGTGASTEDNNMKRQTSWAAPPTRSPKGNNVERLGCDASQLAECNKSRAHSARTIGGVEENKGAPAGQLTSMGREPEIEGLALSHRHGASVGEPQGISSYETLSVRRERALDTRAGYSGPGGGVDSRSEPPTQQVSPAKRERELEANTRSERYRCCAGEGKGPCVHEIAAVQQQERALKGARQARAGQGGAR